MMIFGICLIAALIFSVSIAIKTSLMFQLAIVLSGVLYIMSDHCKRLEIGALIPVGLIWMSWLGLMIGDLIYLFFYSNVELTLDSLVWFFKP